MGFDKKRTEKFFKVATVVTGAVFVGLSVAAYKCKKDSTYENEPEEKNPMEGKRVIFVEDESEAENADGRKGHRDFMINT